MVWSFRRKGQAQFLRVPPKICAQLAATIKVTKFDRPKTLDEADAAVLRTQRLPDNIAGSLLELCCPPEGRFALAFKDGGAHRA